ncbi:GHKL domain-containing protein [Paenibacillus sp. GSMTC-2017]|uniref:sensor histidine kinase n=1 Tax=Paenibacillus sp. GSMTC-2017 TaxID=2794350 RepID=UPI0018D8C86E|nr:ATP-binding protein [Paenibacillus sp. GSMTC-2017]MBH5317063.1 GHKL domain-containing protein [Paenibacillus sp. GSMTC-2017]
MKDRVVFRLVFRSFVNLILSAILALISVVLLYYVADFLSRNFYQLQFLRVVGRGIVDIFPSGLGIVFLWVAIFMVYFFILQWMLFSYFDSVNETVRRIADGQLDMNYQIVVKQSSTFGVIASNVNRLSNRLHVALEDERKAEQTKNELITNVSHDLRTPLTSIIGYLGLIEQDRYRDEVELRHYVQIAYDKSQRLHELIDDLFEYTRMRHDSVILKRETFNLVEMLGQLLVQYHMPLQEVGMESKLDSEVTSISIRGDAAKLVRVFENLISNAMSYGKEGKFIELKVKSTGKEVIVEVSNFGDAIPAIDLPHIFDRFYRGDKSRTQWSGGSGLGLAISKSIIDKHDGTIEASSDSERTTFRVTLPRL